MDFNTIDWTTEKQDFLKFLNFISEEEYKKFSLKTSPGVENIIGVRLPVLKTISRSIIKSKNYKDFLNISDDNVFEIKILKAYVIAQIKDIELYKKYFLEFLPCIDSWAVCDTFIAASKIIKKDRKYFYDLSKYIIETSLDEYKVRVALVILLDYFVDSEHRSEIFSLLFGYRSEYYYTNMALAWLISEFFIKYPEETKGYLKTRPFDFTVTKMIIRKVRDSYRVSKSDKEWTKKISD